MAPGETFDYSGCWVVSVLLVLGYCLYCCSLQTARNLDRFGAVAGVFEFEVRDSRSGDADWPDLASADFDFPCLAAPNSGSVGAVAAGSFDFVADLDGSFGFYSVGLSSVDRGSAPLVEFYRAVDRDLDSPAFELAACSDNPRCTQTGNSSYSDCSPYSYYRALVKLNLAF